MNLDRPAVLLVTSPASAAAWTAPLEAAGYTVVLHARPDPNTYRWIRDDRPAAVIVDTAAHDRLPLLHLLRRGPRANAIPVITAGPADAARVAATLS